MRTKRYVLTVDKNSDQVLSQLHQLKELRKSVSLINRHTNRQHYVKLQGRWGKNNPLYVRRSFPFASLQEASRWDVYVYEK